MSTQQLSLLTQILGLEAAQEIQEAQRVIEIEDDDSEFDDPELDHNAALDDLFLTKTNSDRRTSVTVTRKSTVKVKVQPVGTLATVSEEHRPSRRRPISMNVDFASDSDDEEVKRVGQAKNNTQEIGELEMSSQNSSEEVENPLEDKILEIASKFDGAAIKFGTALQVKIYDRAPPTTLVEINENKNQQSQYKRIRAQSVLPNFDKDVYDLKRNIFQIIDLPRISKQVFEEKGQAYFGKVSCIRLFNAKNGHMVFLGNSAGYIQIFDIKSQKQLKPLYDVSLAKNEVTCIEISKDGHYLLAGYKQGILALWDCARFRLAHLMRDVAKDESTTFSIVRILQSQTPDQINIATVEKESGRMCCVSLQKQFLGKYTQQITIQEEKNVNSLEVHRSSICDDSLFLKEVNLAAYGITEIVKVIDLKDAERKFKIIERPSLCSDQAGAILSWGYGITPADNNQSRPLLAVAWDKIIKLMTVNEQTQDLETSGYYCSDSEINQTYFVSDSLLAILVNSDQVKLISTEKFKKGTPDDLIINKQSHEALKEFKAAIQSCKECELENLPIGDALKRVANQNNKRRTTVVLNLDMVLQLQKTSSIDFQNSTCFYKQSLALLCKNKIMLAKLTGWKDFMEKLVHQDGADWLTTLKAAIDIYNGEMKGFAQLPAAKHQRQIYMQSFMKTLIFDSIQTVIKKYYQDGTALASPKDNLNYQQIGEVAIKVAIEFCLTISEVEYLFSDMYRFFVEKQLEDQFVIHLCQPIISGQLLNDYVPEEIFIKLIKAKEQEKAAQTIEQIILNANLEPYVDKVCQSGKPVLTALTEVAKKFYLVAAAFKLIQTGTRIRAISEQDNPDKKVSIPSHVHQQKSLHLVLDMLLNRVEVQMAKIDGALKKNQPIVQITREDLRLLRNANKETKQAVEKSCYYGGYHFFWILGLFLRGRKFPTGTLDQIQHKMQVLNIVDFVTNENNLCVMLDFDAETFFITMVALFSGKPWVFINHAGNYKFKFLKKTKESEKKEDVKICKNPIANKILGIFKLTAERFSRKEPKFCQAAFQDFVLRVIIQQANEQDNDTQRNPQSSADKVDFDYDLVLTCLKGAFKAKSHGEKSVVGANIKYEIDQQLIIDALKASNITEHEDLDQMIELANTAQETTKKDMYRVKIQLYENKQEYFNAFMQHFSHDNKRDEIFKWIDLTIENLKSQEIKWKMEQGFKSFFNGEILKQKEEEKIARNKKEDDESDSDNSEHHKKLVKAQSEVVFQEDKNPYPPLAKLKQIVKDRMLKLAQYNSERTMQLIDRHFSEGDFQEKFIMNQFSKFPEQQLAYLKTFIKNNKKEIEITMQDTLTSRAAAEKYERYLVQFTKLLCKYDPKSVEHWVSKPYFPVLKCLPVCKDAANRHAEAVLTMRNGRPHDAIDIYTQILNEFNIPHLLEQIKLLYKDEPSFLQNYMLEEDHDLQEEQIFTKKHQNPANTFALSQIADFDTIIGKACQICMLDDLDIEERQKCWFKILRYLQNFFKEAKPKCDDAIKTALEIVGSSKYSSINEKNKQQFVEKLEKFITVRINYILKFPGLVIPLKQLVEQFQMSVDQIKQVTMTRMNNSDVNFKIESTICTLMQGQSCDIFNELVYKLGNGYSVEPIKRMQSRTQGRKKCYPQSICSVCTGSICAIPEIEIFACGHFYHLKCLKQKQIENDSKSCPVCLKVNFIVIREDFERRLRKNSKLTKEEKEGKDQLEIDRKESRTYTLFNQDEEEENTQKMKQLNMLSKKFDQFDLILDDINLELREFEEARF